MSQPTYPLHGLRVVDMTTIWAGPQMCSAMGDMGAEVIKIESHRGTDQARLGAALRSEYRRFLDSQRHARSRAYYVTLNLASPEGIALLHAIIRSTDIFVCNLSPKVVRKYGIGYERLRPLRPDLIMATISAAGHTGPWSDLMAFGPAINPVVGTESVVGYPEDGAVMMSYWDPDAAMGVMGFYAVMLALWHREETGEGQYIDLAFTELLPDFLTEAFLQYQMTGRVPGPQGNRHSRMAPHNIYPCSEEDTWVSIAVATDNEWQALCGAIGRPELAADPRFGDLASRQRNIVLLDAAVADWTRQRTDYQAMEALQAAGVAGAAAFNIGELYHDPHDVYRRTSIRVEDPGIKPEDVTYGIPWRLSQTPGALRRLGRPIGADNQAFYTQVMGLPAFEVERLTERKVLD